MTWRHSHNIPLVVQFWTAFSPQKEIKPELMVFGVLSISTQAQSYPQLSVIISANGFKILGWPIVKVSSCRQTHVAAKSPCQKDTRLWVCDKAAQDQEKSHSCARHTLLACMQQSPSHCYSSAGWLAAEGWAMLCLLRPRKAAHSRSSDLPRIQLRDQVQQDCKNNRFSGPRGAHSGSKTVAGGFRGGYIQGSTTI